MLAFDVLRKIREFERAELPFIRSIEDLDIVREIGFRQQAGQPLTLKELYELNVGTIATIQRRLAQLKRLGVLEQVRVERDRRSFTLHLRPSVLQAYDRYLALLRKLCRKAGSRPRPGPRSA
jgi:hypothetical protein